jgi:hypothetical protein
MANNGRTAQFDPIYSRLAETGGADADRLVDEFIAQMKADGAEVTIHQGQRNDP